MLGADLDCDQQDDLVNRLAGHGIRYLGGGGGAQPSAPAPVTPLLIDLAHAPNSRLRSALVALLLRHPEYATAAEAASRDIPANDPARLLLLLSVVVAAALESEWSFALDLYLPHQERIDADCLAAELGLPSPGQDFGRACLAAADRLFGREDAFPMNYQADWENAVRRLLAQLVGEERVRGA